MTTAQFEALNERRVFLIHRQHTSGLSAEEEVELEQLREQVRSHIHARFPSRYEGSGMSRKEQGNERDEGV